MIFTLRSNQARVERAEKAGEAKVAAALAAAKAAEERAATAVAAAEERTKTAMTAAVDAAAEREKLAAELAALQQAWESWNERRLAAAREDRPFTEPPPGTASGMNGGGRMSDDGGSA